MIEYTKPLPRFSYKPEVGMKLYLADKTARDTAPEGRDSIVITTLRTDGWIGITYSDGRHDYLTYTLLMQHWCPSKAYGTPLWNVLNG